MYKIIWVGLGGFLGASGRYLAGGLLHRLVNHAWLPIGTLGVNILGCLLIGMLGRWAQESRWWGDSGHLFVVVGILGGFTTFSSFGFETVDLLRNKQPAGAVLYVTASVLLGLLAVFGGYFLAGHHR
ncbi:fluoride efflux transporter CrcB [Planctomycetota bacterium]